jgi:hypothetical protein
MQAAEQIADKTTQVAQAVDLLLITKERVKAWEACHSGYRWFLDKFPQGGQFAEVYASLQADKRYDDSGWLLDKVFAELDSPAKVAQTVLIAGADRAKIEKAAADGVEAATTGEGANAATTGNWANAATTGYRANAATTGYRANAATTGEGAVAAALGIDAKAKAGAGGAIMLAGRDSCGALLHVFASKVGENGIKPDVWYELDEHGKPIETEL